ncbi:STAS domain-containing protein [Amycolatopsis sacchari]|uniref:STAS domain-containing protein n=1 Tax=Amycolatopsis sacchari TaxID=115433 RepID=UPI003D758EE7
MTSNLQVHSWHENDYAVIAVQGEISWETATLFSAGAQAVLDTAHPHLLLDLAGVTFCDSAALRTFLALQDRAHELGGKLTLAAVPRELQRMIERTGLSTTLHSSATTTVARNDRQPPGTPRRPEGFSTRSDG